MKIILKLNEFNSKIIDQYYNTNYNDSRNNAENVGWYNNETQYKRFDEIIKIGIKNNDTVLDFGCGLGDLYTYCRENNLYINYIGVDINKKFININNKKFESIKNVKFYLINTIDDIKDNFDWFVASGSFTLSFTIKEIIDILKKMFIKCNKGIVFNL
jgi:ubiquinone/menaquinone biosynthesis C-methylase UbiE